MRKEKRKFFLSPSKPKSDKMIQAGYCIGHPKEAGWYLFAVRSNDEEELYFIFHLWFNPMSVDKFYEGGGIYESKSIPFRLSENIRAYLKPHRF